MDHNQLNRKWHEMSDGEKEEFLVPVLNHLKDELIKSHCFSNTVNYERLSDYILNPNKKNLLLSRDITFHITYN